LAEIARYYELSDPPPIQPAANDVIWNMMHIYCQVIRTLKKAFRNEEQFSVLGLQKEEDYANSLSNPDKWWFSGQ
jgi:hypothetical protein